MFLLGSVDWSLTIGVRSLCLLVSLSVTGALFAKSLSATLDISFSSDCNFNARSEFSSLSLPIVDLVYE